MPLKPAVLERVCAAALVCGAVVVIVAIVVTSLDPERYYHYSAVRRATWSHPTWAVLALCAFTALEAVATLATLTLDRPGRLWQRALVTAMLLGAWAAQFFSLHAAVFELVHLLWVCLLVLVLLAAGVLSGVAHARESTARRRTTRA